MKGDLERVLFDEPAIHRRLDDIAAQISNDYRELDLTVIAVLHGSLMFVADLLRRIPLPLKLDCLSVASYHGKGQHMAPASSSKSQSRTSRVETFNPG
jgi:hypoxanthine phosphoribosyltransferase